MKTQLTLTLGVLCALSGIAHAQTYYGSSKGVQLKDIPDIGPLFRARPFIPSDNSLFGPEMPLRPKLDSTSFPRLTLSALPSPRGEVLQLEAVRQNRAAILKKITDVMGVRAVIDPRLEERIEITQVFRGLSWDDLLASVNYGVEMVKSPAGTYFFADAPITPLTLKIPSYYDLGNSNSSISEEQLRQDPRCDPFVYPFGGLPQPNLKGWGVEPKPQPNWEKREFNGHEFYHIPLPKVVE